MSKHNRERREQGMLEIPGMNHAAAPVMNLAQPFNDIQLVAIMASRNFEGTVEASVHRAMEIVAEAVVQQGKLAEMVRVRRAQLEDERLKQLFPPVG